MKIYLPKTALKPEVEFEWKVPQWSNTIERDRARTYFQAYSAAAALYFLERAFAEVQAGRTKTWTDFKVPDEAIGCGFHEAVRGVLSHHLVIRNGKIANYHPYPPPPWNANPRDIYGTPGPYEDAVQNTPILRERAGKLQGHRHHAHRAQLRSVFAARRPHVSGWRQDLEDRTFPDVWYWSAGGVVSDDERPRLQEALARIDALVSVLDRVADAGARDAARELLELVLDLHGLALVRAMAIVTSAGGGKELAERLARDEQVRAVLLLHGLHPEPFEERVRKAVECLRPELESLGCRMRLVEVRAATAWLRIEGVLRLEAPRTLSLSRQIEAALIERGCDGLSTHPRPNNVNSAERHFSPDIRI